LSGGDGAGALGVVRGIEASLAAGGFQVTRDSVAGRQVVIGRRSEFRLRRPGSRSHVFVLVGVFKNDASPDHLDRFLDEAADYATTVKGGLRSGTCAVAIAVVDSPQATGDWAMSPPAGRGPCPSLPVLVDLENARVVFPDGIGTGTLDSAYLGRFVRDHVVPSVGRG
jgi:hypothetical protein